MKPTFLLTSAAFALIAAGTGTLLGWEKVPGRSARMETVSSADRVRKAEATAILGNVFGVSNTWTGSKVNEQYAAQSFWGRLRFGASGSITAEKLHSGSDFCNIGDPTNQTGAVRDGVLYIPEGLRSTINDFEVVWKRFDLTAGKWLSPLMCGDDFSLWMLSMTYDPVTDAFYGMCAHEENNIPYLNRIVRVDLDAQTGLPKATVLKDYPESDGVIDGFFYYPADKKVYCYSENMKIYELNRETGNVVETCVLTAEDPADEAVIFPGFESRGPLNLVYSPRDKKVLLTVPLHGTNFGSRVYAFSLDDGLIHKVGDVEGGYYLTSLYTPDTYADPQAADQVEVVKVNLDGASTSGTIDVKLPSARYNGVAYTGALTLVATADGKEIARKSTQAGATENVAFSLAEGLHKIVIRADISKDLPGPDLNLSIYTGNDTPSAPTALKLDGNTLSWTAPGAVGFNGGYVQTQALTYDVYFNNVKQNAAPLSATSYQIPADTKMSRVTITVRATANGKTSIPSEGLGTVIGEALKLPYTSTPTKEQALLFNLIDSNRDGSCFYYDTAEKSFLQEYETYQGSNDWLVLPALTFEDTDKMYEFSLDYAPFTPYYGTENLSLCIGTSPNARDMKELIDYPSLTAKEGTTLPLSARFSVKEPGVYYLAVHSHTNSEGAGSRLNNFSVKKIDASTAVPAVPEAITVKAAPLGELNAEVEATLPTLSAGGANLSGEVTLSIRNLDLDAAHVASVSGRPGEKVSVKCPSSPGFNTYKISAVNSEGEGPSAIRRIYVGEDIPKIVENLRSETSEDNMTMTLSWNRVTEGVNGGYVNPDNVSYQVWYNSQGVTWARVGEPVKVTQAVFNPNYPDLANWRVSVFAQNDAGFLKAQTVDHVVEDILGKPIELPLVEPFGVSGPIYRWNYDRRSPQTQNSSIRQVLNEEANILGIGTPTLDDGSGRLISSLTAGQATEAELYVPKIRTKDQKNPVLRMRWWSHRSAPRFEVLARKFSKQESVKIAEFTCDPATYGSWVEYLLPIPEEYLDEEWVQIRLHFYIPQSTTGYGLIDNIDIYSAVDKDVKLSNLSDAPISHVGDEATFEATVTNAGQERVNASLRVDVVGDGKVLDSQTVQIQRLNSLRSQTRRFTFTAKPEYLNCKKLTVRATAELDGDELPENDTRENEWEVIPSVLPMVSDLSAERTDNGGVKLAWSEPRLAYGAFDDIEYMYAWDYDDVMGQWKNVNNDNLEPYGIEGLDFPGAPDPRAWQVMDAEELQINQDPRLGAHSGKQYLMAMSGYDPERENEHLQVSKWLISPEVKGGTRVKFWVNSPVAAYRETLHVMYSTTDDKLESFTKLCNRSKEGDEGWEQTYFDLPANAKYFALVYVGWDTMGILIDDIEFEPANPDYWDIEGYDVYRMLPGAKSFTNLGTTDALTFDDTEAGAGEPIYYYVRSHAEHDGFKAVGPASNVVSVGETGVAVLPELTGVTGGKGEILLSGLDGKRVRIFTADGLFAADLTPADTETRVQLSAGVYIVISDGKAARVLVR